MSDPLRTVQLQIITFVTVMTVRPFFKCFRYVIKHFIELLFYIRIYHYNAASESALTSCKKQ